VCRQRCGNDRGTAEGATPATAQAQEPLEQANLESVNILTTEGAHGAGRNLSGTKDRWGAARFRAAPFFISEAARAKAGPTRGDVGRLFAAGRRLANFVYRTRL